MRAYIQWMDTSCENCARPDEVLVTVFRVYEIPEAWDEPGSRTVLDEVERWCLSCASQYPNEPAS